MENSKSAAAPAKTEGGGAGASGNSSHRGEKSRGRGGRGGGRGRGQGRGRGDRKSGFGSNDRGGRHKKADMGRGEYGRQDLDRRQRNEKSQAKREANGENSIQFTKEEIEAERRKPKKKVAVMIGYAGSGYKGMQINALEKTIEGDLFDAFVKAGAISKANADDPKKSSLVRCARTDKGVHAAGNVISLKLIIEDPDIVAKINEHLPAQIRVWGMERTNGSFSCYQTCDSRWYEYLIPTFSFLPPHPESFLAKKLDESAKKENVYEKYADLQKDGFAFWENFETEYLKPILDKLDPDIQTEVMSAIYNSEEAKAQETKIDKPENEVEKEGENPPQHINSDDAETKDAEPAERHLESAPELAIETNAESRKRKSLTEPDETVDGEPVKRQRVDPVTSNNPGPEGAQAEIYPKEEGSESKAESGDVTTNSKSILTPVEAAIKEVKAAIITAKKAYRISAARRARVQEALNAYLGTRNFHNYTILKRFSDPSAKRVIRSFQVGETPVIINNTEWLSLKVHGQSFMMHQIRKMVGMAALVVRCASPMSIIPDSYTNATISIPKAPGLGLLLERPVFQTYNDRAMKEYGREKIDFDKYQKEMDEFKQREIYDRIFREEERDHQFHSFFHHIDHYKSEHFLWVTATGLSAAKQSQARKEDDDDDEADINGEEG